MEPLSAPLGLNPAATYGFSESLNGAVVPSWVIVLKV